MGRNRASAASTEVGARGLLGPFWKPPFLGCALQAQLPKSQGGTGCRPPAPSPPVPSVTCSLDGVSPHEHEVFPLSITARKPRVCLSPGCEVQPLPTHQPGQTAEGSGLVLVSSNSAPSRPTWSEVPVALHLLQVNPL